MKKYGLQICVALILILLVGSCSRDTQRSFYYWKSVYQLSSSEKQYISDLHISKLYLRFFDLDWKASISEAVPIAKIRFAEKVLPELEIIPVVYIVNKALLNKTPDAITALAAKILKLTEDIARNNGIAFHELQIDCDWTDKTRDKYFELLKLIKAPLIKQGKILSATIRLHQIKYRNFTGIPDVDRGMLMYYNMGKISANSEENSIYNPKDAAKYIASLPNYPLPLDVALPAFSWGIHIRQGKVIELLNNMNSSDFEHNPNFKKHNSSVFSVKHSVFFRGYYFKENDQVKVEEISPSNLILAAEQLKSKLNAVGTVAIFHLDSLIISTYEKQNFEKIFNYYH